MRKQTSTYDLGTRPSVGMPARVRIRALRPDASVRGRVGVVVFIDTMRTP